MAWITPPVQADHSQAESSAEPQAIVQPPQPVWAQPPAPADPTPSPVEAAEPLPVIKPEPFATPADPRLQSSKVLRRHFKSPGAQQVIAKLDPRHYTKHQLALSGIAIFIFLMGLVVSLQTMQNNHNAIAKVLAQVGQLGTQTQNPAMNAGQTASKIANKPDAQAFSQYTVAADLARYVEIPKLGIVARVSQVGIDDKGALSTPDNPYDTAWYSASVAPGKPGVVLIDGLASSSGSPAIFADLAQLAAGDPIQVVRGDGTVINYRVVNVQAYDANQLTMPAVQVPATPGKPGLNLLSIPDTAHGGTQSVLVQAEQN